MFKGFTALAAQQTVYVFAFGHDHNTARKAACEQHFARAQGPVNHKRVYRIMRQNNLLLAVFFDGVLP